MFAVKLDELLLVTIALPGVDCGPEVEEDDDVLETSDGIEEIDVRADVLEIEDVETEVCVEEVRPVNPDKNDGLEVLVIAAVAVDTVALLTLSVLKVGLGGV